jgi:hypothetical protein
MFIIFIINVSLFKENFIIIIVKTIFNNFITMVILYTLILIFKKFDFFTNDFNIYQYIIKLSKFIIRLIF